MSGQGVVLVVEDDVVVRMFACQVLNEHNIRTIGASSADEAINILQNQPDIDTVLTDIIMPGTLDGLGLVSKVRGHWPRVGIIVASGRMPAAAAGNAAQTVFLAKPFDERALLGALAQSRAMHV